MSKLNVSIATALAAAAIATVSAAQAPSVRTGSTTGVSAQQSGPVPATGADLNQPTHEAHADQVGQAPAAHASTASPASAPPAATAPAPQPAWASAPPRTTSAVLEAGDGEVSTRGEVRLQSETASPEKTYTYRFSATVDVANVLWRSGRGYDLFSDRDASWRLGVGFGYDALRLPENLVLTVEAGFLHEPAHGENLTPLFGSLSGSLAATTVYLGPALRWVVAPWLAPYARAAALATSFNMTLDAAGATSWDYQKWAGGALLGAGVLFTLPQRSPVNFGVLLEGGLWLQGDVPIQLERELPPGAIATASARVGTLENTGPYLRVAGVLRF